MLFDWLGHGVAFKGLHNYLKWHAHGNAVTEELWAALEEASGERVGGVMRHWTLQCGYPYLYVSTTDSSAGALHRHSLKVASGRHMAAWAANVSAWPTTADFAEGPSYEAALKAADAWKAPGRLPDHSDWSIPLSIIIEGSEGSKGEVRRLGVLDLGNAMGTSPAPPREEILGAAAESIAAAAADAHARWIKVNAGHAGFFRTLYDPHLLGRLLPALRTPRDRASPPALTAIDRLGLIGDVWAGVQVRARGIVCAACAQPTIDWCAGWHDFCY